MTGAGSDARLKALAAELSSHDLVMVLSTARRHGRGVQRLPDRFDRGRRIGAVQVETNDQAAALLPLLDRRGRTLYLDVERKHHLDLLGVARASVTLAHVTSIKPNDLTVDALDALVMEQFGEDATDLPVVVYGTGNLAFKFALRLAERGAGVALDGRNTAKVRLLADAINAVLPRWSPHPVVVGRGQANRLLVSAVTAESVIGLDWLDILAEHAVCVDAGIYNLAPTFIEGALAAGHQCLRLDTRTAGDPLPADRTFFRDVAGRSDIEGVSVVAGGLLGRRGEIIVDRIVAPVQVVGIASGTGGLVADESWSHEERAAYERVAASVTKRRSSQ